MESIASVHVYRDRTNHFGQLTGRLATNHIHLEEAVLAVHEPRRKCQIEPVLRRDHRNARRIARNRCVGGQAISGNFTVCFRETRS